LGGGGGGALQPIFRSARSSRLRCLARHAGHREVVKKAQVSSYRKASELLRETQVQRGGRAHPGEKRRAISAIVPSARRQNAPRPSPSASPFAGRRETGGLSWLAHCVRAVHRPGAGMKCGRGNRPHHARAGTTEGCAAGSRRGLARRKAGEPSLGSVGTRAPFTFGWVPSAWLDARVSPQGAARANAGMKHVASCRGRGCDTPQQWPVHRRICRSRQAVLRH